MTEERKGDKPMKLYFPVEILTDKRLNPADRLAWGVIRYYDNERGCFATNETIARKVGCTRTTISRIVKKLIKLKLLDENLPSKGRANTRKVASTLAKKIARRRPK
ncbi:helix-turn-helix domain-containing protein [Sediminibacterium roseum]|uniref:Helix-turn-helix domain-containing protein n=1 Tax=Sediminibacterium roseum TaxID=1978412 RepID=A0ABW9ZVU9_9BACT|nr:helix-turn-helix domain-containing protein [Sediminibacterium roseum]NCI48996.1 helix-turn-helix domain-containing protein [Sediminibacterium roseum]